MSEDPTVVDLTALNGDVRLAGSAWLPSSASKTSVLMFPGSGPADRDNDVVFPPIREHLVDRGIAVASFDKRGVGGSGGDWRTVGMEQLASDAIAQMAALRSVDAIHGGSVGLLGHSQGGWVVVDAAATDTDVAFVVTHSGPAVGVGEQDRFAVKTAMAGTRASDAEIDAALGLYIQVMAAIRRRDSWDAFVATLQDPRLAKPLALLDRSGFSLPSAEDRRFLNLILDHDPAPALRRLECPVLAIFGENDELIPVGRSIEVLRHELGNRGLLKTRVLPEADHRMRVASHLVPGYVEMIADWILWVAARNPPSETDAASVEQ